MINPYERGLLVKAMVLQELGSLPVAGDVVLGRVARRGAMLKLVEPSFDFQGWVGCTLWELLWTFDQNDWCESYGESMFGQHDRVFTRTERGERFIGLVATEAPHIMKLLGRA